MFRYMTYLVGHTISMSFFYDKKVQIISLQSIIIDCSFL